MADSLLNRVEQTAGKARRLQWAFAAVASTAAIVLALLLLGLGDWLVRPLLWPGRFLLSLLAILSISVVVRKFLGPLVAAGGRIGPVLAARRIEHYFPQLKERLSAAVAFLIEDASDSPALRRSVVAETEALAADCTFDAALDLRPLRRAAFAAGLVLLLALGFVLAAPASTLTAVARLAIPWGGRSGLPGTSLNSLMPPQRFPTAVTSIWKYSTATAVCRNGWKSGSAPPRERCVNNPSNYSATAWSFTWLSSRSRSIIACRVGTTCCNLGFRLQWSSRPNWSI